MKEVIATDAHIVARDDLVNLIRKHADKVSAVELLAIAAHMVGQLVAMQDQRRITPAAAMQVVAANVEAGNQSVVSNLNDPKGSA